MAALAASAPCSAQWLIRRSGACRASAPTLPSNVRSHEMQLPIELIVGAGVAASIAVALVVRHFGKGSGRIQRPEPRGPANLRFICAGCSQQFTHTRRTLGAWEKGTRRFYCNACHAKWRSARPPQPSQPAQREVGQGALSASSRPSVQHPSGPRPPRAGAGSGCLGMLVLAVAVPVGIAFVVARYA